MKRWGGALPTELRRSGCPGCDGGARTRDIIRDVVPSAFAKVFVCRSRRQGGVERFAELRHLHGGEI